MHTAIARRSSLYCSRADVPNSYAKTYEFCLVLNTIRDAQGGTSSLRVRSRVQKPYPMRYPFHNQCDGGPHSTPTSGTINPSSIAVRWNWASRAPPWGARRATRSTAQPQREMAAVARDKPTHRHAHSWPTVPPLAFSDQQNTDAAGEDDSKVTLQVPQRKPPARAPSGPPHALQTEAHDPMRFADIVALIKAPDSKNSASCGNRQRR